MLDYVFNENLKVKAKAGYHHANNLSRGTLGILVHAYNTFNEANAAEAAASIAYYALFSLFPLLLFLVTMTSSILESEAVVKQVLEFTAQALPTAQDLVEDNIEELLNRRSTMGTVAAIGLLWGATSVFVILTRNINKAWHSAKPRNFLQKRLVGLIIVGILVGLLILSLMSTTIFKLLPSLDMRAPLWDDIPIYETYSWRVASRLVPWFFTFVMCLSLYRWIPTTKVGWTDATIGALVAATAGEITKSGLTWYLSGGFVKYDLVYGSLATLVILMLSIYLVSLILLFCAHLSASISYHRQFKNKK